MATVLPAGVSESDVTRAIDAFTDVLGADAVITDPDALRAHVWQSIKRPEVLDAAARHA